MKAALQANFIIIIFTVAALLFTTACSKTPHYELSRFVSPETCGGCHTEIYTQWKGSLHNLSQTDMLYLAFAKHDLQGLTDPDEIEEAESCVKCHVPLGVITGYPKKLSDDAGKIPDLPNKGIQCDLCHSAVSARKLFNAHLEYEPGNGEADPGTKRGPRKDAKSDYHKSAYSAFHTGSEICAACHDVRHVVFGTKLETPYEEWKASAYNDEDPSKRVTCQGCHMYQKPGVPATGSTVRPKSPGQTAYGGPERDHVHTHYFVGANALIPDDETQRAMAVERLKHAAGVEISGTVEGNTINITVRNTGAGHKIPTGLMHFRRAWLEVKATSGGKTVYLSGGKDSDGYLDEGSIIYTTVFGDGKGNPVINLAKAREILKDRRIPPKGTLIEKLTLPDFAGKTVIIEARLLYASGPQRLLDKVLGKGKLSVPVIEMASHTRLIRRQ